jgi:hypothetical protein
VTQQPLSFSHPTTLIVSSDNPGATELARELAVAYPELTVDEPSESYEHHGLAAALSFSKSFSGKQGMDITAAAAPGKKGAGRRRELHDRSHVRRFFMLYLNDQTFLGEAGNVLADQVRAAPLSVSRWPPTPCSTTSPPQGPAPRGATGADRARRGREGGTRARE